MRTLKVKSLRAFRTEWRPSFVRLRDARGPLRTIRTQRAHPWLCPFFYDDADDYDYLQHLRPVGGDGATKQGAVGDAFFGVAAVVRPAS
jgi:hypothetical protein